MFTPWVEDEAKRSLEMAKKYDKKMDLPSDVREEIERVTTSLVKKDRLEVDGDSFYVLIKLTRREIGMTVFKDLEDATEGFEEWLKEGISADDLDLVEVKLVSGKLDFVPVNWKKVTERLVKGRRKNK